MVCYRTVCENALAGDPVAQGWVLEAICSRTFPIDENSMWKAEINDLLWRYKVPDDYRSASPAMNNTICWLALMSLSA